MSLTYRFGPQWIYELDIASRTLLCRGQRVGLGARAFDLLLALLEAGGQLVTKEQLLQTVWPGLVVEEANVYVNVSALRKLLGGAIIATVGGLGYRLASPVELVDVASSHHNLPAERTNFVGREAALDEARRRLVGTRLMTLIGIGGTGKTRLALKMADKEVANYPDGVWWTDLAPLNDGAQIALAVANAAGCSDHGKIPVMPALIAFLRGRKALLVLDNCEHLLDPAACFVDSMLMALPGIRVVATSREALGLDGELVLPVRPMELPTSTATTDLIVQNEAVCLFMDRTRAVAPTVGLNAELASVVAEICRRLDGVPLALELAAARMNLLSAQQLLRLLDERFLLLTGGVRALPRQQTLQAMIQWSYEAAGHQSQRALSAMSVCAGGCDLDTLAALLGESVSLGEAMDSLGRLLDKSLLSVDHQGETTRYFMLETVRHYALDRLGQSGEASAVRDRHRDYFLRLSEDMCAQRTGTNPAAWTSRFDVEQENLLRAMAWCDGPGGAVLGLRFAIATLRYWSARGLLRQGRDLVVIALARPGAEARTALRSEALSILSTYYWWLDETTHARDCGQDSLEIARELNDLRLMGWASRNLSYAYGALGDHSAAGHYAQESHRLARMTGDSLDLCNSLVAVADHLSESGKFTQAAVLFEEVFAIRERLDLPVEQSLAALGLADLAIDLGHADVARDWLRKVLALFPRTRSRYVGQHLVERSAALAALTNDWGRCVRWFSASAKQRETTGLSGNNMSKEQREKALAGALYALGEEIEAHEASVGMTLDYAAALREVEEWLK